MSAAIYFVPEAYTTSGPKVMGRNSAGESFLRGFAAHSRAAEFWGFVRNPEHAEPFTRAIRAAGRGEPVTAVHRSNLAMLKQAGALYCPDPGIADCAWQRAAFGDDAWSLCGITHTVCSSGVMDSLTDILTAPVQPWDALICTSNAVKDVVTRLLGAQLEHLRERLGATRAVLPQLPVIPLGIDSAQFVSTPAERSAARQALGIDDTSVAVLFVGRLSFHAKAHPLPQYLALEQAARATGKNLVLIECGRHASPEIGAAFAEAAHFGCPSVRVLTLDSAVDTNRRQAWAAADIFSSLSDNLQESFGLTPLEAMASGLPLVVSDWDGYKDTVRDQLDGFRVPTLMPQAGYGADLALRHALDVDSYDWYSGFTSQLVAVDVDAATAAFIRLIENPQLRGQMGESGRRRVREHYDWSVIIPRYEALWAELADLRKAPRERKAAANPAWPARMDPFRAFAAYPTRALTAETRLHLKDATAAAALERVQALRQLKSLEFAHRILPTEAEFSILLTAVAGGPRAAGEIVGDLAASRRYTALRSLAWLVKVGVLAVTG